jgi:hypothetical protein
MAESEVWREYLKGNLAALNDGVERVFQDKHDAPVPEVMAALRETFGLVGMTPTDDFLRPYAEAISDGRAVKLELD